ncbi:hypothetical protein RN001_015898 [Aquatica leii]|uniref:SH3 domain-containing protein n=1 Tax=Aquatica leii TaxID=1421715 RepID=A0AAN7PMK1_9COLE|nr:hypothetical protein RN001_015898 [Aquatica leii]
MRIPTRPAPSIEEAFRQNPCQKQAQQPIKKKPPPRPPPPNFDKVKSKSAWNLDQQFDGISLIDLSPLESQSHFVTNRNHAFGGSVSSSFSSSTSSLASSKKSFEYDSVNSDPWSLPTPSNAVQSVFYVNNQNAPAVQQISVPTIIRPQSSRKNNYKAFYETCQREQSPPMPSIPPPSPPKEIAEVVVPYGIALYDYPKSQPDDLALQVDDVVFLIRKVNSEWFYGRVEDREGMFPVAFISVHVPLPEDDDRMVTALYEFKAQEPGDLTLKPGQSIHVTSRVSEEWLMGESEGKIGQFPSCFVDRVPSTI